MPAGGLRKHGWELKNPGRYDTILRTTSISIGRNTIQVHLTFFVEGEAWQA